MPALESTPESSQLQEHTDPLHKLTSKEKLKLYSRRKFICSTLRPNSRSLAVPSFRNKPFKSLFESTDASTQRKLKVENLDRSHILEDNNDNAALLRNLKGDQKYKLRSKGLRNAPKLSFEFESMKQQRINKLLQSSYTSQKIS